MPRGMSTQGRRGGSGGVRGGGMWGWGGQHKTPAEGGRLLEIGGARSDPETSCWEIPLLFELHPSSKFRGNVPRYIK